MASHPCLHGHISDHQQVGHDSKLSEYSGLLFNKIPVHILYPLFFPVGIPDTSWGLILYLLCIFQMPFPSVLLIAEPYSLGFLSCGRF